MLGMMPMAMSQMPTLGNPQAQAQQQEMSLAQVLQMYQQAQQQMERSQEMQSPEYIQNSGGLGALAMAVQAYMGKRGERKAEGKVSELAEKAFRMQREEEAARAMAEYQRELAKEERKFGRDKELVKMRAELPGPAQLASIAVPGGTQQVIFDQKRRTMTDLGGNPLESMMAMAGQHGGQITSTVRSPEKNAKVGGVPNSQHLSGTAMDAVFSDPQAKAAYMEAAQGNGFEVIDEGDHLHTELPPGYGRPGFTPSKPEKPEVSTVQQRRKDLRELQASGVTVTQGEAEHYMKTGKMPNAGERPSATQIRIANNAKQKLTDLRAVRQQLNLVREKFQPLKDSWSAGGVFGVGGNLVPSEDGERFDASVDLLRTFVRKLTRTPGEGAMSDWEGRLANLANPSRGDKEAVTEDKIAQLEGLLEALEQGYGAMLQDSGGNPNLAPSAAPDAPQQTTRLKFNPATGRIE